MPKALSAFAKIIGQLTAHQGSPAPPAISDPLHLILWESIGYLVADDRREMAFAALRQQVGLKPVDLLSASSEELIKIAKIGGIHPELRAQRLKEIACIVLTWKADLSSEQSILQHLSFAA